MVALHTLLAYLAAVLGMATLALAVVGVAVGRPVRIWLDRLILLTLAALVVAAIAGLPLTVLVGVPADVLHLLYGLVGPLILVGGRYLGRSGSVRRRSFFVALASLAVLGVVYRLFTTGGVAQ